MPTNNPFNFDYSYLSLPDKFYSLVKPGSFPSPEIFLLNDSLCNELGVSTNNPEEFNALLSADEPGRNTKTFAQAYAGHQFGHFTMLGDGRAIIIGEHLTENNNRFDIQLKGSGRTRYSRGGDGKATLKAMLREYLISEAMHNLNIPTSRSLAVIKTGEPVFRETMNEGAVLLRVMKSHIRVGTFEYAAHFGSIDDLKALTTYTIKRLYPEIEHDENPVISLLNKVIAQQTELIANWMRVGFIHGVMNTDNTSISGETFDYGPCAFMNAYHPDTVFSSIDSNGRYSYGNQPKIIKWNIARFAEALLPIIHPDKEKSLELAQNAIDGFDEIWKKKYYGTMLNKIGFEIDKPELYSLVDELFDLMKNLKMDYTNTFRALSEDEHIENIPISSPEFKPWIEKWNNAVADSGGMHQAKQLMKKHNPLFIPRNHLVEQALDEAVNGNLNLFEKLLAIVKQPYQDHDNSEEFMKPSEADFERSYQTFCGT
jgi:serine/tyrosine/threonine adenylyltransferase